MNSEEETHGESIEDVDPIAAGVTEAEWLLNEINLLKLEGLIFCFDPKAASRRITPLSLEDSLKHPVQVEPHPSYGQPSVLAYKVLQAIFLKLTAEGRPFPETVSFSQRELSRLVGRATFSGRNARELYRAIMQLHRTAILCSFYNKDSKEWVQANFYVLPKVLFSGKKLQIKECVAFIDPVIVSSLNAGHYASFNWNRLQYLEPIGAALYKRLFFHFSNLRSLLPKNASHHELGSFEKDYEDMCLQWLGGLKPAQHRSVILRDQLGRHLDDLKRMRLIRAYDVVKKASGDGWKLVFQAGNGFFNDYEEFYLKQATPQLRPRQSADLRNIQQPLELVAYLHHLLGDEHTIFDPKEVVHASRLLDDYLYDEAKDFIRFSVETAHRDHYEVKLFGGIMKYLPLWRAERDRRVQQAKRQEVISACTLCDEHGFVRLVNSHGKASAQPCPHDRERLAALEQRTGYRWEEPR